MTNREFLESLTDEEFACWLCYKRPAGLFGENPKDKLYPYYSDLKGRWTSTFEGLKEWLKQEHDLELKPQLRFEYKGYRVIIVLAPEKQRENVNEFFGVAKAYCIDDKEAKCKQIIFYNECDFESEIKKYIDNVIVNEITWRNTNGKT